MVDDRCESYQATSACRWSGWRKPGYGTHKRGLNTKIHLAVDAHCMPIKFLITAGIVADCTKACTLIDGLTAEYLLTDRGYDSNKIVEKAISSGVQAVIPSKKNRKEQRAYDKELYKLRHLVENAFLHLKRWHGIAT